MKFINSVYSAPYLFYILYQPLLVSIILSFVFLIAIHCKKELFQLYEKKDFRFYRLLVSAVLIFASFIAQVLAESSIKSSETIEVFGINLAIFLIAFAITISPKKFLTTLASFVMTYIISVLPLASQAMSLDLCPALIVSCAFPILVIDFYINTYFAVNSKKPIQE
ncbi:MAG: hypothetical protein WCP97_07685 [bacterium]